MPCPYVVLGAARDRGLSRSHSRLFRPPRLELGRRTPLRCGASMRDDISQDPYRLGSEDIEDPPRKFSAIFRRIGPGE